MQQCIQRYLVDEQATRTVGRALGQWLAASIPCTVFLEGDLGAGKTTLVQGFLAGLDYQGPVKSPTYTLVESYAIESVSIYHFDLYRLKNPIELVSIGIEDYVRDPAILLVEWPERGAGYLPAPDVVCSLDRQGVGRTLSIKSHSERALSLQKALLELMNAYPSA